MQFINNHVFTIHSSLGENELRDFLSEVTSQAGIPQPFDMKSLTPDVNSYKEYLVVGTLEFYRELKRRGVSAMRFRSTGLSFPENKLDPYRMKNHDALVSNLVSHLSDHEIVIEYEISGSVIEFFSEGVVEFFLVILEKLYGKNPKDYALSPGIIVPNEVKRK